MKTTPRRAWLITPFAPAEPAVPYSDLQPDDLVIAVDGGLKRCFELSLSPRVLLGDMDSLEPGLLAQLPSDCQKITYLTTKNETDTELAMQYCIKQGSREIHICNDLSGRFDHALGLIQNLLEARLNGGRASILSTRQLLFLLDEYTELSYPAGSLLSLVSLTEESVFDTSSGLQYPLNDLKLYSWQSRGISNRITEPAQSISLSSGTVLAIVTLP
jgi:thiamine pyrophosphokinase